MIKVCSLYSGSSGNCIYVTSGKAKVLVDCGLSGKKIEMALEAIDEKPNEIDAFVISHEHSDHIKGIGVFARRYNLPIYASHLTWKEMSSYGFLGEIPVNCIKEFETGEIFSIKDIDIKTFSIPHDAVDPVGFNFIINNKKITTATDIGHMNRTLLNNLENSNLILLESNHDVEMLKMGKYPWPLKKRILGEKGHLCNEMAGKVVAYLAEKGTKKFILGHLSKENNFPELAYQTVLNILNEKNICVGKEITLEVASREGVSAMMEVV